MVGMMNQPFAGPTVPGSHIQGIYNQIRCRALTHGPAYNRPGEYIYDYRQVKPPFTGSVLRNICHPQLVGSSRCERPLN